MIRFEVTQYGFKYGDATVTIGIESSKYKGHDGIQIYVTKTGKIRIHDKRGEWTHPKHK